MITSLPTGRIGRVLAVSMAILFAAVLWLGIVQPIVDLYNETALALQERYNIAEHMAHLADQLPNLEQRSAEMSKNGILSNAALQASSNAVATAMLQSVVNDIAAATGASLGSVESLPAENAGAYQQIGLKLSLVVTWPVFIHLLGALEQATPPMVVDDLQIQNSASDYSAGTNGLDTRFTVYAFRDMKSGAKP